MKLDSKVCLRGEKPNKERVSMKPKKRVNEKGGKNKVKKELLKVNSYWIIQ